MKAFTNLLYECGHHKYLVTFGTSFVIVFLVGVCIRNVRVAVRF